MSRFLRLLPYVLLGAVALTATVLLAPSAEPNAGIALSVTYDQALHRARTVAAAQDIAVEGLSERVSLVPRKMLVRQLQTTHGLARGNELLRSGLPAYAWQVRFTRRGDENITIRNNSTERELDAVRQWLAGEVTVTLDGHGRLLGFTRSTADSLAIPSVSADSARTLAQSFLLAGFDGLEPLTGIAPRTIVDDSAWTPRRIEQRSRIDHEYQWMLANEVSADPVRLTVRVAGNVVTRAEAEVVVPDSFKRPESGNWQAIIVITMWVGLVITMIVISFRRFRAYEIGFRMAWLMGIAAAVIIAFELSFTLAGRETWDFFFPLLMSSIFYGGGLVITWAVSESVVREAWPEKMVPLDLIVNGHFIHSRIGVSVVVGSALGVLGYAVDLGVVSTISRWLPIATNGADEPMLQGLAVFSPAAYAVTHAFYASTYLAAFFVLFLVSWLRRRLRSTTLLVLITALGLAVSRSSEIDPWWGAPLLVLASSIVFVLTMVRFDAVAGSLAVLVYGVAKQGALLHVAGAFESSALGLIVLFAAIVLSGLAAQFRKKELTDFDAITPAFARNITERERLQHELAIARTVQMSFLPKKRPDIPRLDVASRCEPAQEVGGDYFDFIPLPNGRWGIAVGDVSGKGTQAAFFMTLTKGFLRAIARTTASPAAVLTSVNRHFYENVERGAFISIVYGVYDPERATMTLARAGHNPVMLFRNGMAKAEVLNSTGLALGMDPGPAFEGSIQETVFDCRFGDVFVFYTDGISEAMNRGREEFGDDRLAASIARYGHGSADQILSGIFADVAAWAGKQSAHDDRTLVAVKVL
ncbi:MAG: PP2C family protein-serine/threonine phosphatase [Bacteroidetes bacterium]|jgi:serine phosphatase RsbU (regulator of sigma subunit)|nr:PP2C family protein-serine/threonine phosphatase [Bacteroidota bacterium]